MEHAARVEAHNRHEQYAEQVLDMHLRGESFRAIEAATGVPRSTAQHMCQRLSSDYVKNRYNDKTAVLGRELAILDSLTRKNLKRAQDGDKASADIVLNAHIRRSKLLGLDAAVRSEITVKSAQDIEIERLVSLMRDGGGTEGPPEPESGSDQRTATVGGGSE
jgi:hypothetical protein